MLKLVVAYVRSHSSFESASQDFSMDGEEECLSIALMNLKERDGTISTQEIRKYWVEKEGNIEKC